VRPAALRGGRIGGAQIPQVIDEVPILSVLAAQSQEGMEIRDGRIARKEVIRSIVGRHGVEEFECGTSDCTASNTRRSSHRVALRCGRARRMKGCGVAYRFRVLWTLERMKG
jgi:hypothetical protein